jgi:hypothetical protein
VVEKVQDVFCGLRILGFDAFLRWRGDLREGAIGGQLVGVEWRGGVPWRNIWWRRAEALR